MTQDRPSFVSHQKFSLSALYVLTVYNDSMIVGVGCSLMASMFEIICTACGGHLGHVLQAEGFKTPLMPGTV
jgi:peptide methionine sulfoxide reductase MsrB